MLIRALRLYQFRNLHDQSVRFLSGANFLHGDNGQGKTNFVEAVGLLSSGRSFRTSNLKELIRWQHKEASVFAEVESKEQRFELGVAITEDGKTAYINGNKVEYLSAFLGKLLAVTFSPTDLSLVRGTPQERRRFMDKHLVDFRPSLINTVLEYHRTLKSKNALLRAGVADPRQLDAWDELLAERGLSIFGARQEFLRQIEDKAAQFYREFSRAEGDLSLRLKSNLGAESHEDLSIEKVIAKLREHREREIEHGSAIVGPHRDDMVVDLGGKPARAFASQGQARSIVLALKLAVVELIEEKRDESPLVLLDDVESELDAGRRRKLIDLVFMKPRQVFMTGTAAPLDLMERVRDSLCLQIEGGSIVKLDEIGGNESLKVSGF
ncbi:MAG: DNA replication/repair protein RecF [Oligoflexia bacterium]|nr:DNA replication/repair protein RecF [Oligoflexia bacterium]